MIGAWQDPPSKEEPSPRILAELSALADGTLDPAARGRAPRTDRPLGRAERALRARAASRRRARVPSAPTARRGVCARGSRPSVASAPPAGLAPARNRVGNRGRRGARGRRARGGAAAPGRHARRPLGQPGRLARAARDRDVRPPSPVERCPVRRSIVTSRRCTSPTGGPVRLVGRRPARRQARRPQGGHRLLHAGRVSGSPTRSSTSPALKLPNATTLPAGGTELQSFTMGERIVVTWRRAGHTCVLSGVGVSPASSRGSPPGSSRRTRS